MVHFKTLRIEGGTIDASCLSRLERIPPNMTIDTHLKPEGNQTSYANNILSYCPLLVAFPSAAVAA
jgi:hypothetical protein